MTNRELCEQLMQMERERLPNVKPLPSSESPTIHYTELPAATLGELGSTEWNFYRREAGRLIAEGHEGRWLLIRNEEIIGIWDTEAEADEVRLERFLMQPVLMKRICTREPILRGGGYLRRWR